MPLLSICSIALSMLGAAPLPEVTACLKRGSDLTYCLSTTGDEAQIAEIHRIALERVKAGQEMDPASLPFFVESQSAARLAAVTSTAKLFEYARSPEPRTRVFGIAALQFLTSHLSHGYVEGKKADEARLQSVWPDIRPACQEALGDSELAAVRYAILCLRESGDPRGLPPLAAFAVKAQDGYLRSDVLEALRSLPVDLKNKEAVKALLPLLRPDAREAATGSDAGKVCAVVARYVEEHETWARADAARHITERECRELTGEEKEEPASALLNQGATPQNETEPASRVPPWNERDGTPQALSRCLRPARGEGKGPEWCLTSKLAGKSSVEVAWTLHERRASDQQLHSQRVATRPGEYVPLRECFSFDLPGEDGEVLFVPFYAAQANGTFRGRAVLFAQRSSPRQMRQIQAFDLCPEDCQQVELRVDGTADGREKTLVYRFTTNGKRYTHRRVLRAAPREAR